MHENEIEMLEMSSRRQLALDLERRFALNHSNDERKPWEAFGTIAPQRLGGPGASQGIAFLEESDLGPEVVSDVKEKRWSSRGLHNLLGARTDQPRLNPQLEAHDIDISKARIENPDNILICWSSLGALLLYFMGGDDKAGSKDRVEWFLNQAKRTFGKVVARLEELQVDRSGTMLIDKVHVKAFQEQLRAWPKAEGLNLNRPILGTPLAGFGVSANMESEVHIHLPHDKNGNVFHGTVLCVSFF